MFGRRRRRREAVAEEEGRPAARGPGLAAAAVGTAGAGIVAVARLVMTIAVLIALLIAAAIVLRDVDANASNSIVKAVHNGANFFAGSFTDIIKEKGHPKRAITINWGIAAVVYLIVGAIISSLIARVGRGGVGFARRRSPAY
jgi:hypothetical protein